jgi:hypothetical protein
MAIEALYPYIAVAYGTFGLVFGVALWWKTQKRIDRTKSAIETQVAAAVTDITAKVDEKLDFEIPKFDTAPIMARLDAFEENIPDFDLDPLFERLDKLEETLPNTIGTHVNMAVKGVQAEQARAVSDYLQQTLPEWERMSKDAQAELMTQVNPAEIIGNAILNYKIPPQIRKKAPWAIPLIEGQKLQAMQWLSGMAQLKAGQASYDNSGPAQSGSFRPGYNP